MQLLQHFQEGNSMTDEKERGPKGEKGNQGNRGRTGSSDLEELFNSRGALTDRAQFLVNEAARRAAQIAVRDVLLTLGIDTTRHLETQQDFAVLRQVVADRSDPEYDADMIYLRNLRKSSESVRAKGMFAAIGILMTAVGGLLALGLRAWLTSGNPPPFH